MKCETIDEMIKALESIKERHGGDCRVLVSDFFELMIPNVCEFRTGKSDKWKIVTRGGNPCVVIKYY